jgi:putative tryptophan/tyrosine transport system substrate-binding protein
MNRAINENFELTLSLIRQHKIPTISISRFVAERGALMSYGPVDDEYARAASYVDRILKGEKPGDLPVQYPVKYELVINLKTAKALGLDIAPAFLSIADQLIQ